MVAQFMVEVEQALGPGVAFDHVRGSGLVGRQARDGGVWLGYDRAALVDSDDGQGSRVPAIVGVPTSTFEGALLAVELTGAWRTTRGLVLVGRVPGAATPSPLAGQVVAGADAQAVWLGPDEAARQAQQARRRYRERRSHARISGGRAWHPSAGLSPEAARFATSHSAAEYRLDRLPPRFMRGLAGLLDDDERVLYWVERPQAGDVPFLRRLRRDVDRRAALLALTDRQLLWLVDHAQPDTYGSDWGVDVELMPVERIRGVRTEVGDDAIHITLATSRGTRAYLLPVEMGDEIAVMRSLLDRFTAADGRALPRRTYAVEAIPFDVETAARFGQQAESQALLESAAGRGDVLAMLFNPRRPGQRSPVALVLYTTQVALLGQETWRALPLADVTTVTLTLSPLVGRIGFEPGLRTTYPAPLMDRGARFVRMARRVLATLG